MNQNLADFKAEFVFDPKKERQVGVEREIFLVDPMNDRLTPRAEDMLRILAPDGDYSRFSYEPSACQVEMKTAPCFTEELAKELRMLEDRMDDALFTLQLRACYTPVAPANMPMDLYPDPTGRYQSRFNYMTDEARLAAFRIIATNVHVGMPDHETALRVYNKLIGDLPYLLEMGDTSEGKRLEIYKSVTADWKPVPFADWGELHRYALEHDFAHDPRSWWSLVRISRHGTIELRTLDATHSLNKVILWARSFHALCIGSM